MFDVFPSTLSATSTQMAANFTVPTAKFAQPTQTQELVVALATALHRCGTASHDLEEQMGEVVAALGVEARFFATPTAMFIQLGRGPDSETRLVRLDPPQTDLGRTRRVARVVTDLLDGSLLPEHALHELEEIDAAGPPFGSTATALAFSVVAASAAHLFGGNVHDILIAGIVGACVGAITVVAPRLRASMTRLFEPVAAFVAAFAATILAARFDADPLLVTLTALIVLLPGLSMTQAMSELSVRNLASGTARLMGAATVLLMIAFGVALGRGIAAPLADLAFAGVERLPGHLHAVTLPAWTEWIALCCTAVALIVLLSADLRDAPLVFVAVCIAVWGQRLGSAALGPQLGASLAALSLGLFANVTGRLSGRPPAIFLIPGLLLLVPGSLGLRSLDSMLSHAVMEGLESAFATVLVAVSLVAGLLVANAAVSPSRLDGRFAD